MGEPGHFHVVVFLEVIVHAAKILSIARNRSGRLPVIIADNTSQDISYESVRLCYLLARIQENVDLSLGVAVPPLQCLCKLDLFYEFRINGLRLPAVEPAAYVHGAPP